MIYYDLENKGAILTQTQTEANVIEKIEFDPEGKFVFTASQHSLKAWEVDKQGRLRNKYDVKWKGVLDLKVSENEKKIMGLSATPNEFKVWVADWSDSPVSPPTLDPRVMLTNQNIYNIQSKGEGNSTSETRAKTVDEDLRISNLSGSEVNLDVLKNVRAEHRKFVDLMKMKYNHLKPIIYWLNSQNVTAAVNAINR